MRPNAIVVFGPVGRFRAAGGTAILALSPLRRNLVFRRPIIPRSRLFHAGEKRPAARDHRA